jgi:hypothetical protein
VGISFIVRENKLHTRPMALVTNASEFGDLDLTAFQDPFIVEYVDVSTADGYFRKARAVVVGEKFATFRHLIVSPRWEVRRGDRIENDNTKVEEQNFFENSIHLLDLFIAAAKKLGTPTVSFDFSMLPDGQTINGLPFVLWEANPFSCIWADDNERNRERYLHHLPIVDSIFLAQLELYLTAAKLA